jgi:hypothetical protein
MKLTHRDAMVNIFLGTPLEPGSRFDLLSAAWVVMQA